MTDYPFSPEVLQELEALAQQEHRSVADVLNDIVRDYVARRYDEKISAEAAHFREQHPQLLAAYDGEYVAMHDGQVVDHDRDVNALHRRVRAALGSTPVLIAQVTPQPIQEFRMRRTRLEPRP